MRKARRKRGETLATCCSRVGRPFLYFSPFSRRAFRQVAEVMTIVAPPRSRRIDAARVGSPSDGSVKEREGRDSSVNMKMNDARSINLRSRWAQINEERPLDAFYAMRVRCVAASAVVQRQSRDCVWSGRPGDARRSTRRTHAAK